MSDAPGPLDGPLDGSLDGPLDGSVDGTPAGPLTGQAVVVTGAARGVGRGVATALLERGASVLLVDLLDDVLGETVAELTAAGHTAVGLTADLREARSAGRIVEAAVGEFGRLTGLVNNAVASNEPKAFTEITDDDYALVFETGPLATFRLMQAAHPALVEAGGGSIVNFGSGSGTGGLPGFGAYAAAKEAIRGMSKVAALEWGRQRIRVNTVCPFADTPGTRLWRDVAPRDYERAVQRVPLGRIGDPRADVGALVAFLLSDDGSYLTAQTIHVDGGTGVFR